MSTATRRKYRFPSRAAAEEACQKADLENLRRARAMSDMVSNALIWFERGAYRAAVSRPDACDGAVAVVIFAPPTGQRPSVDVHELDAWAGWVARLPFDSEETQGLRELSQLLKEHRRAKAGY